MRNPASITRPKKSERCPTLWKYLLRHLKIRRRYIGFWLRVLVSLCVAHGASHAQQVLVPAAPSAPNEPRVVSDRNPLAAVVPVPPDALAFEQEPLRGLTRAEANLRVTALQAVGARMFADLTLSISGKLACSSCHSPAFGFGPANDRAVQLGGAELLTPGVRAVPSLTYLQMTPVFTQHYYESDDDGDESIDSGPTGGLTWDGRAGQVRDQIRIPLLSDFEMANHDLATVVGSARKAGYVVELQQIMQDDRLAGDDLRAFEAIAFAFEVYEQDPKQFFPYTSKYDASLRHRASLNNQEQRGLAAFNDPSKGNCASCHTSKQAPNGALPAFTDHGLIALGLPRNREIPANADPNYFDMGLCGPMRTDLQDHPEYCGLFKTPSLRNVVRRRTFFHNGLVHDLRSAVAFYVERDTAPERWYKKAADGTILKYDDLPKRYAANIDDKAPFGGSPGDVPVLSEAEIDDVVAFLKTLTDGYDTGD